MESETALPPLPAPIGRRRRVWLTIVGWLDRWRYRKLGDVDHTHFTRLLLARHHEGCVAVDRWAIETAAGLNLRLAVIGRPEVNPARTAPICARASDLPELGPLDRLRWAQDWRSDEQAVVDHLAATRRCDDDQREVRRITAASAALPGRARHAKAVWLHHLEEQQAIYGRARTSGFGQPPLTGAELPPPLSWPAA